MGIEHPVIPTRRVDERCSRLREKEFERTIYVMKSLMGILEPKQLEYCSRLCEKELKRLSSNVKCATFEMMSRSVVSAASDVASELPTDEQVVCQDLTGELSNSLTQMRKETYRWKTTKWRHEFDNHKPKSSIVVCCHERELCGFVNGDDFNHTSHVVLSQRITCTRMAQVWVCTHSIISMLHAHCVSVVSDCSLFDDSTCLSFLTISLITLSFLLPVNFILICLDSL